MFASLDLCFILCAADVMLAALFVLDFVSTIILVKRLAGEDRLRNDRCMLCQLTGMRN